MTIDTTCTDIPTTLDVAGPDDAHVGPGADDTCVAEGWQALALAELGRPLTAAEAAAAERLAAEHVVDLLFPGLSDPARHEVLSTLG